MIHTKCVYEPSSESDGNRYLVTRYWPREVSKKRLQMTAWLRNLAPSKELLHDWKDNKITWKEYEYRYNQEMENEQEAIKILADLSCSGTITLLCIEKEDNPHCHRHLLKEFIQMANISYEARFVNG